jgi:regulatory protein
MAGSLQGDPPALDLVELAERNEAAAEQDARYRRALDVAVRLLAQREHSVRELTVKLCSKGVDAALAALVVDDLRGRGLQSDARFAESFVHSRIGRAQGPVLIREELRQRGVDDALVDEVLRPCKDEWLALARSTRGRKFGDDPPGDRNEWARQARFLARRGFPADVVYRALGNRAD